MEAGTIFHSTLSIGRWNAVGEVVGVGPNWRVLFEALMGSPEHRRIMMDCRYDRAAIGFARDASLWVTGRFYDGGVP
jgi:uncharacterized protein YkwD